MPLDTENKFECFARETEVVVVEGIEITESVSNWNEPVL